MSIEREFEMIEFNNGIFHTVKHDSVGGKTIPCVWIVDSKTGERITFVRTQTDLDWSINKLMLRREAETGGRIWV